MIKWRFDVKSPTLSFERICKNGHLASATTAALQWPVATAAGLCQQFKELLISRMKLRVQLDECLWTLITSCEES